MTKHVEGPLFPFLDAGSIPAGSTKSQIFSLAFLVYSIGWSIILNSLSYFTYISLPIPTNMNSRFSLGLFLSFPLLFLGCAKELMISNPKRPTINPTQLEVRGDKIDFTISSSVPPGTLSPDAIYKLTPKFFYASNEMTFDPIEFRGSKRLQNLDRGYSFDYLPEMGNGKLQVVGDFNNTKTGEKVAYRLPLLSTQGIITTSRLLKEVYVAAHSSQKPYFVEMDTLRLDYTFTLGSHEVLQNQINTRLNQKLDSLILSDKVILGSRVIGTHSPVGSDEVNRVLSERRATEVKKIFDKKIVNHTSTELDRLDIRLDVEFNSWLIFIEKLKTTNLWKKDQEIITKITSNSYDYETVKSKLLALPDIAAISREVFPKLQMSRLEIAYGRTFSSQQELKAAVDGIINAEAEKTLPLEDVLSIARLEPDARRRIQIYESAEQLGNSWELYNDWAATYLDSYRLWNKSLGDQHLLKANDLLQKSMDMEPSAEASVNLGIVNSIAGRFDVAMQNFEKADSQFGIDNMAYIEPRGVAEIKSGNYVGAINSLSKSNSSSSTTAYNLGLAYLLANKHNSSLALLDTALTRGADSAQTLYTKAISAIEIGT